MGYEQYGKRQVEWIPNKKPATHFPPTEWLWTAALDAVTFHAQLTRLFALPECLLL
jgi:hypothetical protein